MPDATRDYQWKRYSDLRYRIELSILYHRRRGRFLCVLGKLVKCALVLSALHLAALVLLSMVIPAGDAGRVLVEGFLWVLFMAMIYCMTNDLQEGVRTHKQLTCAHYALLTEMVAAGRYAFENAVQLDRWEVQFYDIERSEPAVLTALMILCENQLKIVRGQPDKVVPLNWGQRLLAQLYDFPRESINGAA